MRGCPFLMRLRAMCPPMLPRPTKPTVVPLLACLWLAPVLTAITTITTQWDDHTNRHKGWKSIQLQELIFHLCIPEPFLCSFYIIWQCIWKKHEVHACMHVYACMCACLCVHVHACASVYVCLCKCLHSFWHSSTNWNKTRKCFIDHHYYVTVSPVLLIHKKGVYSENRHMFCAV